MSKISVVYWSQTGNTQAMAEAIGNGIKAAGKEAEVVDVSSVSLDDLPPAACAFTEQDDSVLREVMALEPKYREVLLLHYYQNMDAAECARALRITVSGFYRRLKKAQARLKPELERWGLNER